jgi:signal transduction histidine kinase
MTAAAQPAKVLIIDDEEIVLDSCAEILSGPDYRMATATDGARGLAQVREFRPDVVVVDLKMPGLSGFEVLERLRAADPAAVAVVITGYATVSSAVEAMKQGAYDFLPKPFTPDEFRLIIRRSAEKRRLVLETAALKRERDALREHFAAVVSHELKAPLAAIQQNLFALEQALADLLTEPQRLRLERMKVRLGELIALITTWRRSVSADIECIREHFQPVAVATCIAKASEQVHPHAERKSVAIVSTIQEPLGHVAGDEGTLVEALVNVLDNAVKYSRPDTQIAVSAQATDDHIEIEVRDRGVGIATEDLPFIFDAFYRGRPADADARGTGLGLALTRRIVEAHGGSIGVESQLGQGSVFVITLPTLTPDQPHPTPPETAVVVQPSGTSCDD